MSAQIINFPPRPNRVRVGEHFTIEAPSTAYADVRTEFARRVTAEQPWWMRILSDHNDPEQS